MLVSSPLSHTMRPDKFSHNNTPLLLTHTAAEIHLLLLCPTQRFFVKSKGLLFLLPSAREPVE